MAAVKILWTEYWDSLGVPLEFQGFGEQLNSLPGECAHPAGLLLLAADGNESVGTIGFRNIDAAACEIKRLYVRPAYRGLRYGGGRLRATIEHAKQLGYEQAFADTLSSMACALKLYEAFGLEQISRYSAHPMPDAIDLRYNIFR